MNELSKRWARVELGHETRWALKDKDKDNRWNWAVVKPNSVTTKWKLLIWDGGDWGKPIDMPTLREAKALGRVLAATATR